MHGSAPASSTLSAEKSASNRSRERSEAQPRLVQSVRYVNSAIRAGSQSTAHAHRWPIIATLGPVAYDRALVLPSTHLLRIRAAEPSTHGSTTYRTRCSTDIQHAASTDAGLFASHPQSPPRRQLSQETTIPLEYLFAEVANSVCGGHSPDSANATTCLQFASGHSHAGAGPPVSSMKRFVS